MNLFIKILLFVLVALIANLKVVTAGIPFINIQKATFSLSFHKDILETAFKSLKMIWRTVVKMSRI